MQAWAEISYDELMDAEILQTIVFKLIVPTEEEVKTLGDKLDLSKSDLNACYCKPLINPWSGEDQSWFDVKLTVQGEHDLPPQKEWFYIVAESGKHFKACFSGKKTKKLISLEGNEEIGLATKGALLEREMVYPVYYTYADPERRGIVTKETLEAYGGSEVFLKKTNITREDRRGKKRDIWLISFPYELIFPVEEWKRLMEEHIRANPESK